MTTIRHADVDDLSQIVAIYNDSIPGRMATADTHPISVESRVKWFESHDKCSRPLYVAEEGSRVVGYLSFRNFYGRPAYHITAELGLYVAPSHHRNGIGSRLLGYGLEQCPGLGVENLLAFIFAHNSPSVSLFQKFGFKPWGQLPAVAELDGRLIDLVILGFKVSQK